MVRSSLCCLREASPKLMVQHGEDQHEPGGYFVCNGLEKLGAH